MLEILPKINTKKTGDITKKTEETLPRNRGDITHKYWRYYKETVDILHRNTGEINQK